MSHTYAELKRQLVHESRRQYGFGYDFDYVPISARRPVQIQYAWSVASEAAIRALVEVGPLVEIGAGTGYWASLVEEAGGDVVCFDLFPPGLPWIDPYHWGGEEPAWHSGANPFHRVHRGGPDRAAWFPERTLFLCWPPYKEPLGADAVRAFHRAGGQRVAFVGEIHGCTGDSDLMAMLGWPENCYLHDYGMEDELCTCAQPPVLFSVAERVPVDQWDGMQDALYILDRVG